MRLRPSHTTVRTGPYTAIRLVKRVWGPIEEFRLQTSSINFSNSAGCSGSFLAADDSDPLREAIGTSSLLSSGKASCFWIFGRMSSTRFRPYWPLHSTPCGDRSGLHGCHGLSQHRLFLSFRTSVSLDRPTPLLRPQLTSAVRSEILAALSVPISGQTTDLPR